MRRIGVGIGIVAMTLAALVAPDRATVLNAASPPPENELELVTLVSWFQYDADADALALGPIAADGEFVARAGGEGVDVKVGKADFDLEDDHATILLGANEFEGYPVSDADANSFWRWYYFNDDENSRPGTLVIQVRATKGPYRGREGTATFVSRGRESDASGILAILLRPA
ncbi:MAG TPA: hypothetical protein VH482_00695 [Thermomicrobiales bacterium]|jgi:hypothetical protein